MVYDLVAVGRSFTLSDLVDAPANHWRYGPLLPLETRHAGREWPIGWTPLAQSPALAAALGVRRLRLKDDGEWTDGWEVLEVWGTKPSSWVTDSARDYKHHRKATDI